MKKILFTSIFLTTAFLCFSYTDNGIPAVPLGIRIPKPLDIIIDDLHSSLCIPSRVITLDTDDSSVRIRVRAGTSTIKPRSYGENRFGIESFLMLRVMYKHKSPMIRRETQAGVEYTLPEHARRYNTADIVDTRTGEIWRVPLREIHNRYKAVKEGVVVEDISTPAFLRYMVIRRRCEPPEKPIAALGERGIRCKPGDYKPIAQQLINDVKGFTLTLYHVKPQHIPAAIIHAAKASDVPKLKQAKYKTTVTVPAHLFIENTIGMLHSVNEKWYGEDVIPER